ncbi:hypothetical protein COLO4_09137 [Corchorus olitorius]|uniref:Uncharacterized protein n=1 Tax=Corchorus olitorius TaxID=93759 RepID=A0A1R3KD32_9ROSI|nr:hypothetical protein COLO4_09137 [Corchorus olitorius]
MDNPNLGWSTLYFYGRHHIVFVALATKSMQVDFGRAVLAQFRAECKS